MASGPQLGRQSPRIHSAGEGSEMSTRTVTNFLLLVNAAILLFWAARTLIVPRPVEAQYQQGYPFYVEPGTLMLRAPDGSRQVYGRMMIDMRTGKVWGFPTNTQDLYPVNPVDTKPQTSHPFYLGKFALEDADR
jgi:hypothetical protein